MGPDCPVLLVSVHHNIEVMQGACPRDVYPHTPARSIEWTPFSVEREWKMVKSCCVVGCKKSFEKGGRSFYNFPADKDLRSRWIAAVRRENWTPNDSTVICSDHFVSGERSKNPLAPNYVPRLFSYVKSPEKGASKETWRDFIGDKP